jgi:O-antigen/teichoic acid export membrane protein
VQRSRDDVGVAGSSEDPPAVSGVDAPDRTQAAVRVAGDGRHSVAPRRISALRRLLRGVGTYTLASLITSGLSLLLVPVFVRVLTPAEFGVVALIQLTAMFAVPVAQLGIPAAVLRYWGERRSHSDRVGQQRLVGTAVTSVAVASLVTCSLAGWAVPTVSAAVAALAEHEASLALALLSVLVGGPKAIALALLQAEEEAGGFLLFSAADAALGLAAVIIAVVHWGLGPLGVFGGYALRDAVMMVPALVLLGRKSGMPRVHRHELRLLLRFGVPVVPVTLLTWAVEGADRYFLGLYMPAHALGVYSLGSRLASLTNWLLLGPFMAAWTPVAFAVGFSEEARSLYRRAHVLFAVAGLAFTTLIGAIARPTIRLVSGNPDYLPAADVVFGLALGYVLCGTYYLLASPAAVSKRTELITVLWAGACLAGVLLNWLLVPTLGLMGGMLAHLGSYAVAVVIACVVGQWLFPVAYDWKLYLLLGCSAIASYAAVANLSDAPIALWDALVRGLGALGIYSLLTCAVLVMLPSGRVVLTTVREQWRRFWQRHQDPA